MTRRIISGDLIQKVLRCLVKELRPTLLLKSPLKTLVDLAMIEMFTTLSAKIPMFNLLLGLEERLLLITTALTLSLMLKDLEKTLERRVWTLKSMDLLPPITWFSQFLTLEEIHLICPMVLILVLILQ